ncbi:MAG: type VI secretion system protein TssA [Acidobacteriia bacterium]|nr:type VI secretion system protein TssA [Terriglobia bacterium]
MTNVAILSATIAQLLEPIPGGNPSGEYLRYTGAYDSIAEARREDDPRLTQGVWKSALKRADWAEVETLCVEELRGRTKDLQIAAWLLESWLHQQGFDGVRQGLELLRALVESFWEDLHPQIKDGELEYRIAPITWINEKLSVQLSLLPVAIPENHNAPPYCWSDWENACRTELHDPSLRSSAANTHSPKLTLAEFQKSVVFTPTEFFSRLAAEVGQAMDACAELEETFDRLCGKQAPSLRQFWGVLNSIHDFALNTLAQRQAIETQPCFPEMPVSMDREIAAIGTDLVNGPISSREEAYRRLAEAADYLSCIEPHSPAPYLVKRAILWGSLRLPELLPELVRNPAELGHIFQLLQLSDPKTTEH